VVGWRPRRVSSISVFVVPHYLKEIVPEFHTVTSSGTRRKEAPRVLDTPLVFVDIDTQRDFLEPWGALIIAGSHEIRSNLARLTRFAQDHHIPILATACSHTPTDPELARFRPHCLAGTPGQERITETACESVILGPADRLAGSLPPHLTLLKRELDLFSRPDADELIARYNAPHPRFVVYGVATDYCIKAAAAGLLARGCRIALVADAVRSIDPAAEAAILTELAQGGALITLTDVVCGMA
jgi:nicotinamidase/pyrazinamidase